MKKRYRCQNVVCRNCTRGVRQDFCPACRGRIALKYADKTKVGKKTFTLEFETNVAHYNQNQAELIKMYDQMEEISHRAFTAKVYIEYLNAYFQYASCGSKGIMLKEDRFVRYYRSVYDGRKVLILERTQSNNMERFVMHYVFSDHKTQPVIRPIGVVSRSKDQHHGHPLPPGMLDEYDEQF